jgi:signal peptidase I
MSDYNETNTNETIEVPEVIEPEKKGGSFFNSTMEMIETAVMSIFIVGFIFTFIFQIAVVQGTSMMDTLKDGEKLVVSKIFYTPKELDIIVIDNVNGYIFADETETSVMSVGGIEKDGSEKYIVKRVIAVSGQEVDIDYESSLVYVDGAPLEDDYIRNPDWHNDFEPNAAFDYPIVIPEGYVFVLGDNRAVSNDSRAKNVGLVREKDIIGHCIFRLTPFKRFGFLK